MEVIEFYNKYSERQLRTGINERHKSILKIMFEFGLMADSKVLEIGCGVGTQSELILECLSNVGSLTAYDISDKSIEIARARLSRFSNLELICADISEVEINDKFDIILFPDVLEHIPVEKHFKIFEQVSKAISPNGSIIVHIPHPFFLSWVRKNRPQDIQIIDQSLSLNHFVNLAEKSHLHICYLKSYSIWFKESDYQVIIMKKSDLYKDFEEVKRKISFAYRIKAKLKLILFGNK